ncbi:MAG: MobA protein [Dysgonamonadaceae bacterium]|jgi:hypothetical protein|nr:MobA protein [Dysgonamonadaceae bacterium]
MEAKQKMKGGRKPKNNPIVFRYSVNFTDAENAEFLSRFEQSGLKNRSQFIAACIFEKQLKVVKYDMAAMEYYSRLTNIHAQIRAIGVNYNQVVKAIKATFTEKKALAFLYKLEKATRELVEIHRQIQRLTAEFEKKWLQK